MTSQRYSFARGTSGALGVFGLSVLLIASTAHAQAAPSGRSGSGDGRSGSDRGRRGSGGGRSRRSWRGLSRGRGLG